MKTNATALLISIISFFITVPSIVNAQLFPLNESELISLLDDELSGESAKRNLEYLSRLHRMRGSEDYQKAVEFIQTQLKGYGLEKIEFLKIPADGKIMYGTQKSRPAWDVQFAELWELENINGQWSPTTRIGNWEAVPLVLAQDSESGDVIADLIDVGTGRSDEDYANKNIKGKLVLTSSQPGAIVPLAIAKYGAAGIISYAQNQPTAWYGENDNLIRWGHLETFAEDKTFAFMVSLKQARDFQNRLKDGKLIKLSAKVKAGQHPGNYDILTAVIEGADPNLKNEEIAFTCHLDHPRPGANDNASGSVTIMEVARTLKKLIDEGKIARPKRTIRFIWSPEIEGTTVLLNYRPALATNIKAVIHMDMVGGGPETKAIFHVSRSPKSLPSFVSDIGEAFGMYLNEVSDKYASGEAVSNPVVSLEGGKEDLHAVLGQFHMGSDFQVFSEGSFRIPSIYLHDWPDRYIHTNYDLPANIDPTKLKRSGFIGAASAYVLANFDTPSTTSYLDLYKHQALVRTASMLERIPYLNAQEQENFKFHHWQYERGVAHSITSFAQADSKLVTEFLNYIEDLEKTIGKGMPAPGKGKVVYTRNEKVKGPMSVFGYDYFEDKYGGERTAQLRVFSYKGLWGSGGEYTYEILNLVNGQRTTTDIRNAVAAEFGPIPMEIVTEFLSALEEIGVITKP
ncbi:MAG: M28 family peptidase [Cyclobacteriaceae bacterium]